MKKKENLEKTNKQTKIDSIDIQVDCVCVVCLYDGQNGTRIYMCFVNGK